MGFISLFYLATYLTLITLVVEKAGTMSNRQF